jgi:hypothetical protein
VDAVGTEDLKVGLEPGASSRVGAGNAESCAHDSGW